MAIGGLIFTGYKVWQIAINKLRNIWKKKYVPVLKIFSTNKNQSTRQSIAMHIYCKPWGQSDQKSGDVIYEWPLMNFEHEILHVRYNTSKLGQTGRKIICKYITYGWWHVRLTSDPKKIMFASLGTYLPN